MIETLIAVTRSSLEEYQNKIDAENVVGFGIIFLLIFIILYFSLALRRKNGVKNNRTNRYERLLNSPDVNTNNYGLHNKRLEIHGRSKFSGTTFYVDARGGIYFISSTGARIY